MRRVVFAMAAAVVVGAAVAGPTASADPSECGRGLQVAEHDDNGRAVCSHGSDPATDAQGASVFPADAGPAPASPCPTSDDGVSGARIQVLYGHPSDTPDNYATSVDAIRSAVAFADSYFEGSDASTVQHLRWLCTNGQVSVESVTLAPIGSDGTFTYSDMYNSIARSRGKKSTRAVYTSSDRVYVTFVDGISGSIYPYCGQGSVNADDRPDPAVNQNNIGPAYALIACWSGSTTLHEIGHNLGAVQLSAPHSSGGYHCYDESDIMCYNDGGSYFLGPDGKSGTSDDGALQTSCVDVLSVAYRNDRQFDCGENDYYNPAPAATAYVATHWNLARSNWVRG